MRHDESLRRGRKVRISHVRLLHMSTPLFRIGMCSSRSRSSSATYAVSRSDSVLGQYVLDLGYDIRFAIEPKPNEPRGDILLPTIGPARVPQRTREPRVGRPQPRGGTRGNGESQFRPRPRASALARQTVHVDLNGQHGPRYDQDLRFGAGNASCAFWKVDTPQHGGYTAHATST